MVYSINYIDMKQETIKIQQGNKTQLCLRPVLPDGTPIPDTTALDMVHAVYTINGHDEEMRIKEVSESHIVIALPETLPIAVYDVKVYGVIGDDERPWSDNRKALFEIVKYGTGISYERYYTDLVIIGLPDQYVEQLRKEWERKIAEAEAAKETALEKAHEYEDALMHLDDIARKGDIPTDYARQSDIPTDYARQSDIPTDYARQSDLEEILHEKSFLAWVENGWGEFVQWVRDNVSALAEKVAEHASFVKENMATKTDLPTDYARQSDIPTDYAKQGEVAKTLDDIKVEIPADLARVSDVESAVALLEDRIGIVGGEGEFVGIRVSGLPDVYAPNGSKTISRKKYYEWMNTKDAEDALYTTVEEPVVGSTIYEYDGTTIATHGLKVSELVVEGDSVAKRLEGLDAKIDTIIANTSLTAAQADEDWQNVLPITE